MATALLVGVVIVLLVALPIVGVFNALIARRAVAHNQWVALQRALFARQAHATRLIELMREWRDANDLILRLEQGMNETISAPSPAHAARADRRFSVSLRTVQAEVERGGLSDARWQAAWARIQQDDARVHLNQEAYDAAADRFNDLVLRRWCVLLALALGLRSVEPYQDGPEMVPIVRLDVAT